MILDRIDRSALYTSLHPRFAQAFEYLRTIDLTTPSGRVDLAGDDLYVLVQDYEPKPAEAKQFESHRRYIDIQYVISGFESMGFGPLSPRTRASTAYDEAKDFILYAQLDGPVTWLSAGAGEFAIFFRDDVHMPGVLAPGAAKGSVKKAVAKIRYL